MKLPESWTENCADLLRAFNKEGVEYLLFGSMAESHYRSLASVGDMDVLINPTPENATKVKPALDAIMCRIHDGALANCTADDLAEPGKHLCLGRNYKDYLNVDLFTAKREFDFREAFPRSIVVEVVHGIPARIASEGDLKILDSLRQQSERAGLEWRHAVESFFVRTK